MTPAQTEAIRTALKFCHRVTSDGSYLITFEHVEEFDKLVAEHAAMTERLRWKRQSEEPAPDTATIVLCKMTDGTICLCPAAGLEPHHEWIEVPK